MRYRDIKKCKDYNFSNEEKCSSCKVRHSCLISDFIFRILNVKNPKIWLLKHYINKNYAPNELKYGLEQLPLFKDIYEKLLILK